MLAIGQNHTNFLLRPLLFNLSSIRKCLHAVVSVCKLNSFTLVDEIGPLCP